MPGKTLHRKSGTFTVSTAAAYYRETDIHTVSLNVMSSSKLGALSILWKVS